jgi:hypothetical protein
MWELSDVLTQEEIAVLTGIKNGMYFDLKSTNKQLYLARKMKYKIHN